MQQNDLNRSVARVTGETVTTIKRLGFVLDDPDHRDDSDVKTIDWDLLEARRYAGRRSMNSHRPERKEPMDQADQLVYRFALKINEQLRQPVTSTAEMQLPRAAWDRCQQLLRYSDRAAQQGWRLAAERCQRELRTAIQCLKIEMDQLERQLDALSDWAPRSSPHKIVGDLLALHEEFDEVTLDGKQHTVSVTTEPIVLEDVFLGPFEIRLDCNDLRDDHPRNFRVIAVDPQAAASNHSITHPHVQDGTVCEGDRWILVRRAASKEKPEDPE